MTAGAPPGVSRADPVAAAAALIPELRTAADEAEGARELPEAHPRVFSDTLATLARGDASSAWISMVASITGLLGAYLDETPAREAFGPDRVAAGYAVEGRLAFTSGCQHADRLAVGCLAAGRSRTSSP